MLTRVSDLHRQQVLQAVVRLEANLSQAVELDDLADQAGMSPGHFHRLFHQITGEPVAALQRRLRLERAALLLLLNPDVAVDVAGQVGYQSREGFVRAFSRRFDCSPADYRLRVRQHVRRRLQRLANRSFDLAAVTMRHLPRQRVAFLRSTDQTACVLRTWRQVLRCAHTHAWQGPRQWWGLSYDDAFVTVSRRRRYDACFTIPEDFQPPPPFGVQTVPAGDCGMLTVSGPVQRLSDAWDWMVYVWLPQSGWQVRDYRGYDLYHGPPPKGWTDLWKLARHGVNTTLCVPVQHRTANGPIAPHLLG